MSILYEDSNICFIDHHKYISRVYKNVPVDDVEKSFELSPNIFSIVADKTEANNRKRSHDCEDLHEITASIKQMHSKIVTTIPKEIKTCIKNKFNVLHTSEVRDLAKKLFKDTVFDHAGFIGGNNSVDPLRCKIKGQEFLVPPHCRFMCGDVKQQCSQLSGNKYELLVADPPWWNKYIRRLKSANKDLSYTMMYNEDIASIPVQSLLAPNCLIAVWCTNAPSNIEAVKKLIFPKWGVQYLTTWYWLKVTTELEPVCVFNSGHKKQPYERLILGKVGDVRDIPENKLFVSIPSALHSHKPPLLDLLLSYVPVEKPSILELFARYLLPNTTSVGYEPLKWQHISLYETVT